MDCRHLEDLYELFVLSALSRDETAEIHEHLAKSCPNCVAGVREAALTLYAVLQARRPIKSTPQQKSRFLQRIKDKRASPSSSR
jgi:hypothetical protein